MRGLLWQLQGKFVLEIVERASLYRPQFQGFDRYGIFFKKAP